MSDTPGTGTKVTADELRTLLNIAGISVSPDRAPAVLDELNAQLALARQIEGVIDDAAEPSFAPYDPTFPKIDLEDEAK